MVGSGLRGGAGTRGTLPRSGLPSGLLRHGISWWSAPLLGALVLRMYWYGAPGTWFGEFLQGQESIWIQLTILFPLLCVCGAWDGALMSRSRGTQNGPRGGRVVRWLLLSTLLGAVSFAGAGWLALAAAGHVPGYAMPGAVSTFLFGVISMAIALLLGFMIGLLVRHRTAPLLALAAGVILTWAGLDSPMYLLYPYVESGAGFGRYRPWPSLAWQGAGLVVILGLLAVAFSLLRRRRRKHPLVVGGVLLAGSLAMVLPGMPVAPYDWAVPATSERVCRVGTVAHERTAYDITTCVSREHQRVAADMETAFGQLHVVALRAGVADLPRTLVEVNWTQLEGWPPDTLPIFVDEFALHTGTERRVIDFFWLASRHGFARFWTETAPGSDGGATEPASYHGFLRDLAQVTD